MSTYAIGDIHGCYESLQGLLKAVDFKPGADRILLTGDLVNRGPASLEVLRWARNQEDRLVTVLGNHDLYLLGRYFCGISGKRSDTLAPVLEAEERDALIQWLRCRPFLHEEPHCLLVHAGLLPGWTLDEVRRHAREVEEVLQGSKFEEFLRAFFGVEKSRSARMTRACHSARVFTEIRICTPAGLMRSGFSGSLDEVPSDCLPWFDTGTRAASDPHILFGHWSTLGYYSSGGVSCLDAGCVHGGSLVALRLEDGEVFKEPCSQCGRPS